jgi:hypothetical protein
VNAPFGPDHSSDPPPAPVSGWRQAAPRLVLGLGLVALGALFTLEKLDLVRARDYLHLWPGMLVGLGVVQLLTRQLLGGVFWTLVGAWLLGSNLGYIRYDPWELWPLLLVALGGGLMLRALRPRALDGDPSAVSHAFAVWSGVARKVSSREFRGGSYTAVMGGCEIDLRGSRIAGGRAVIDTFAFWGGIELKVPPTWRVTSEVWPLMGGFEDKTSPPAPEDVDGELVITGWAIMGGVVVGN